MLGRNSEGVMITTEQTQALHAAYCKATKLDRSKFSHLHGKERTAAYMREWKLKNKHRLELIPQRKCWMCQETKPQSSFGRGLIYECKECCKEIRNRRYAVVRSQIPELHSQWIRNVRRREAEWKQRDPDALNRIQRNSYKNNPERKHAHYVVKKSLKSGSLVRPNRCSKCFAPCKPNGHHHDYSKPSEVVWLCGKCHRNLHYELNHRTD